VSAQIDTSNKFQVAASVSGEIVLAPIAGRLSIDDALHLAAWLVLVADPDGERFQEVLGTIQREND
jgi:hypothetical protein